MRKRVAQPGYAGLRTFCGAEVLDVDQIDESDVFVIGVPFDTTLGSRQGARFGQRPI